MPFILLALFVAGLLLAGLASGATGMSYDSAVGLVLVASPLVAGAVALRRFTRGRLPGRPATVLRPRPRADSLRQVEDASVIAQQVMTEARTLAVKEQQDFLLALERLAARLDKARDRHGGDEKLDAGEWRDGETLFLRATAWRQLAEHIGESLHKGDRVVVTGRLRPRSYEREGQTHTVMELEVDELGASLRYVTAKLTKPPRIGAPSEAVPEEAPF